jgi:hypothetical protein
VFTLPATQPAPTQTEFECCVNFVAASVFEAATPAQDSAAVSNCCHALVVAVDADFQRYSAVSKVRTPCCKLGPLPELWQHQMCTPWGPPVPPTIDWLAA